MPIPIIAILIGAGVSAYLGRKAHDKWADHDPLKGYCSNCGKTSKHAFHQSGMTWKKSGIMAVLSGAAGLGVSSLLARNIYKCQRCGQLTLQCRMPKCKGMALAGDYYDDEFCGQCRQANDNSKLYQAMQDQKSFHKVKEILAAMQREIDVLKAKIAELEREHGKHKEILKQLVERLKRKEAELAEYRKMAA